MKFSCSNLSILTDHFPLSDFQNCILVTTEKYPGLLPLLFSLNSSDYLQNATAPGPYLDLRMSLKQSNLFVMLNVTAALHLTHLGFKVLSLRSSSFPDRECGLGRSMGVIFV